MRGQLAIEFLVMIAMAIMVGMIFLLVTVSLLRDASEEQRIAALNDIGYMVQDEVILATTVADGYRREFLIPQKADRFTYAMSTSATGVTLTSGSVTITYPIPAISGTFAKGTNIITKDGTVTVTQ